jgi:hypothetical protein
VTGQNFKPIKNFAAKRADKLSQQIKNLKPSKNLILKRNNEIQ